MQSPNIFITRSEGDVQVKIGDFGLATSMNCEEEAGEKVAAGTSGNKNEFHNSFP